MIQNILVIILLIAAVSYAAWRVYKAFQPDNDPCAGCEGCALKGKIKEKQACPGKK
jgi:hypothetical protein